jgi:hypothetical protein
MVEAPFGGALAQAAASADANTHARASDKEIECRIDEVLTGYGMRKSH